MHDDTVADLETQLQLLEQQENEEMCYGSSAGDLSRSSATGCDAGRASGASVLVPDPGSLFQDHSSSSVECAL